jgi:hypothetical protein
MRISLCTLALLAAPRAVLACPVCFGQNDSPLAIAMNNGILFMLGIIVAVLGAFGLFIVHLARRARLAAALEAGGPRGALDGSDPQEGIAQC